MSVFLCAAIISCFLFNAQLSAQEQISLDARKAAEFLTTYNPNDVHAFAREQAAAIYPELDMDSDNGQSKIALVKLAFYKEQYNDMYDGISNVARSKTTIYKFEIDNMFNQLQPYADRINKEETLNKDDLATLTGGLLIIHKKLRNYIDKLDL